MRRHAGAPPRDALKFLSGLAVATREIRARERLSQAEVARRGGLGRHTPGRIELGRANPTMVQISQLARGLGLSGVSELLREAQDAADRISP